MKFFLQRILFFLPSFLIFSTSSVFGQFQNVLISSSNSPEEVSIYINPKNPNQVVAGANIDNVFHSTDGGHTWAINTLTDAANGVWGDPCIFSDTAGNFYFIHLANPPTGGNWIDRIVCAKSTDGGSTWSNGTYTGLNGTKAQDKAWTAVNPSTNEIYVTWTQFDVYGSSASTDSSIILFSKSADGGATWSVPKRISKFAGDCIDSDNTVEGAVPAVGPNGEIYVAWVGSNGLVFNKSLDDGNTWLPQETFVTAVPGGWDYNISGLQRCNGLPITLCDLSNGPNRGTIYINWTDQRNGTTDTDVWLIKSSDGGNTWSSVIRVNDDAPGKQQFLTWMCIDKSNGTIYCDYYDRRNYPASSSQTDVYLARSTDGGNTFSNYKINQTAFTPDPGIFFGDYIGISAYNDAVRPIWMSYNGSTLSAWTAIVDGSTLAINELSNANVSPIAFLQNSPNPFYHTTWIKFKLKKTENVNLFVYDVLGTKVATLYQNEKFNEGSYDYIFNSSLYNLKPGVYYYSLCCDEYRRTEKMIVY
ncbi:MAG TPA: T9SS type A sorting domain-containing protein [Bacteroidia bacterium]